jgi:prohibitin 2
MSNTIKKPLMIVGGAAGVMSSLFLGYKYSIFHVETGHRAIKFNKLRGVLPFVHREGIHFMWPWLERPIIYDVRTHPQIFKSQTGSRDLQFVDLTVRVLYRPDATRLQQLYRFIGRDYDERVLPSIVNEVLRSVIAQYNATQLLTQREQVSFLIRKTLEERAKRFSIILDDVSITHLAFSDEFAKAIELKQIAQQDAEKAKFIVMQAEQEKKSNIIRAQGEATSAALYGASLKGNPAFIELRRIEASKDIADILARSRNKIFLEADTLMMNITGAFNENLERVEPTKKPKENNSIEKELTIDQL